MQNLLMIDNWTLEEVCGLLIQGLSASQREEIAFDRRKRRHSFRKVPKAVIQLDALLQLLSDIVLRDELIVDDQFATGWCFPHSPMLPMRIESVVKLCPFNSAAAQLDQPRKVLVGELCLTQSLRDVQKQNELLWRENRTLKDKRVSMIVWGGAGMLARSHVFQMLYTGHPLRQRLINETALLTPRVSATDRVLEIIQTERTKLFQQFGSSQIRTYANFNLPPIAVEVINDARTADELITVAIQLREKYSKLRKWLATYEMSYVNEDTKGIIKHQKKLNSVAKSINELLVPKSGGTTNLSIGISWLKLSLSGNPLEALRNRFGVRAAISKLILTSKGEVALKKLLSFFGEEGSGLGRDTYKALAVRNSNP